METQRTRGRPKSFHDKTQQNTIQSLDRAMGILKEVGERGGATLTELAHATDQAPATVYRVLSTLALHQIVEMEDVTQTWFVGPGAFRVGSKFLRRTNVVERGQGPMQELMRDTGETANLGVERDNHVLFLSQSETHRAIRAFFAPGTKSPMHSSGIGKALLSFYDESRVDDILARVGQEKFTGFTLCDPSELKSDLRKSRARGFALDDQERADGMRCIAAPIFDALGTPVAGVSVSGPAFRLELEQADQLGGRVRQAAAEITEAIGGELPDT